MDDDRDPRASLSAAELFAAAAIEGILLAAAVARALQHFVLFDGDSNAGWRALETFDGAYSRLWAVRIALRDQLLREHPNGA